jgi:hypothetical protein
MISSPKTVKNQNGNVQTYIWEFNNNNVYTFFGSRREQVGAAIPPRSKDKYTSSRTVSFHFKQEKIVYTYATRSAVQPSGSH